MQRTGWLKLGSALGLLAALGGCDAPAADPAPDPAAAVAARPTPAITVAGPERLIIAFGDSLYAGYNLAPGEGLAPQLQGQLRAAGINALVINAGVSGDTTAAGLQRFAFTLDNQPRKPDLLLLGLGANDLLRGLDPALARQNLDAMLAEAKARNIPVLLTGMIAPPNLGPQYGAAFNSMYPALARKHGATLLPLLVQPLVGKPALLLEDGLHPNKAGVTAMVAPITPLAKTMLADSTP